MSRSALWHQEKNIQRRSKEAEAIWNAAIEEGRNNRARNLIPLWGPDDSFRFEPMLLNSIKKSQYFLKICREITSWTALVDEIYYKVDGIEPWALAAVKGKGELEKNLALELNSGGKTPSEAFCLLLRLLTMRSTSNQMVLMLNHQDSPYIRAIGFLYLRYTSDPAHLFDWLKPYLFDDEPIQISANKKNAPGRPRGHKGSSKSTEETIGSFVRSLLSSNRDFFGTMLPRLPAQIEREIQVQLLQAEKVERRADIHSKDQKSMDHFQKLGSKIVATYEDDENPLQWYTAEVDRVILRGEDGSMLKYPKFVVTFTEYGNTETVHLGEMDLPDGKFYNEDQGHMGGGGRASDRGRQKGRDDRRGGGGGYRYDRQNALYDEVRRRERETVTASGRGDYYARPAGARDTIMPDSTSYKSPPLDRRKHSPSPQPYQSPPRETDRASGDNTGAAGSAVPRKRTAEEFAAIQEKKRKLMAKYG